MGGPKREDEAYGKAFSTQRREQPPGGWRNRDVGLLAIVFIVTLTVCGGRFADNPPVVQAERFEVRDKNGKVRAIFGLTEDKANMVELVLMDEVGRSRLRLSVDPTGLTGIGVYDPPEHERIGVISVPNGRAGITIREPVGQDCLSIGSRESGIGMNIVKSFAKESLHLLVGITSKQTAQFSVDSLDPGRVSALLDKASLPDAKPVLRLIRTADKATHLQMMDDKGCAPRSALRRRRTGWGSCPGC